MARQRRSAPVRTQSRSAHTAAYPQQHAPAASPQAHAANPATSQRQPGLFSQMASTAAGVAVGSAVGHTIGAGLSSVFGGSSSQDVAPAQQQQLQEQATHCDADARNFTRCLEENSGNMQICDYYLQQLKACQEASRQY